MFLSATSCLVHQTPRYINRVSKHLHRASQRKYGQDSVSTSTGLLVLLLTATVLPWPLLAVLTCELGHSQTHGSRKQQAHGSTFVTYGMRERERRSLSLYAVRTWFSRRRRLRTNSLRSLHSSPSMSWSDASVVNLTPILVA